MKLPLLLVALLLLASAMAFGQNANSANGGSSAQPASVPAGETTLTGCLSGHHDEYRLTEKNGTVHLLLSAQKNGLRSHVGNIVEMAGHADPGVGHRQQNAVEKWIGDKKREQHDCRQHQADGQPVLVLEQASDRPPFRGRDVLWFKRNGCK